MKILPAPERFELTASRQKQFDALEALQRLVAERDLSAQATSVRQTVLIANVPTYWSRPFEAEGLPYLTTMSDGIHRLFLVDPGSLTVALYDGGRATWRRRVLTRRPEMILAALPRRALTLPVTDGTTSARQLATLRKVLDLPVDHELPALHPAAVSTVIDRVVLGKVIPPLVADFQSWMEADAKEQAA